MSKKSKSEARAKKAANKRAAKAANQLRWSEYAGKESNRKKRVSARKKTGLTAKHTHPNGACGNIGCLKCSDIGRAAHVRLLLMSAGPKAALKAANRLGVIIA